MNEYQAMIPLAVPVILAGLKLILPRLPKWWLPILAPLLGAGGDIALYYAGLLEAPSPWGPVLGAAGVGLREIADQSRKALLGRGPMP